MNCAIKDGGIACDVSVEGNIIKYKVHQKSEFFANCICLVKEMSSVVTGLKEGTNYTLYYWCVDEMPLTAIDFTYKKGFRMSLDTDLYKAPLIDNGDGTSRSGGSYSVNADWTASLYLRETGRWTSPTATVSGETCLAAAVFTR